MRPRENRNRFGWNAPSSPRRIPGRLRRKTRPEVLCLETRRLLSTYIVNDPGDAPLDSHVGPGETADRTITLRSAIEQINIDGSGLIGFASAMTISVESQLDPISAPGVTIDGGTLGSVVIHGGSGYNGLQIEGGGARIENLVIDGFYDPEITNANYVGILLQSSNNLIQDDYLGTNASGSSADANGFGIYDTAGHNTIQGNVASGNYFSGILLKNAPSDQVSGNRVGTDSSGTTALGNSGAGISVWNSSGDTIGGTTAAARNIISANRSSSGGYDGLDIDNSSNILVEGNYIGTDIAGSAAMGNAGSGIALYDGSSSDTIGGTASGAGNLISGNAGDGIYADSSNNDLIAGNLIGTDTSGSKPLANALWGVFLGDSANDTVGGTGRSAGNVISGNTQGGLAIIGTQSTGDLVEGNDIGTDASGTSPLGNGYSGIYVGTSSGFYTSVVGSASQATIGGTAAGAGNVIAANGNWGLWIDGSGATGVLVQGNFIGTDPSGTIAMGNSFSGVAIRDGASSDTVGGTISGAGNTIAFNASGGVTVGRDATDAATGDPILENAIYSNTGLGIDLGNDGVTLNDSSGHSGPNLFQDFPVLSSVLTANGTTTINGTLSGSANTTYQVEFFSNPARDPSGYGQGQTFLMTSDVTTDSNGQASFSVQTPNALASGVFVSATATDPGGNTSEFSADAAVGVPTTTILTSSTTNLAYGETVSLLATIVPGATGLPVPTGTVTFMDGKQSLGKVNVKAGTALFTTKKLAVGTQVITAVYSGDSTFATSTSKPTYEFVRRDGTATVVTSSSSATVAGETVTFTAKVKASAPGSGTPTGSVIFYDGTAGIGTGSLNGSGVATFTTSSLSVGAHAITAVYTGDNNFALSTSAAVDQRIDQASTRATLTSSSNPSTWYQSVTFTATISVEAPGSGTPMGSVTFDDGTTALGTATLNGGTASFTTATLSAGTHAITAVYGGGGDFTAATSAALEQVVNTATAGGPTVYMVDSTGNSASGTGNSGTLPYVISQANANTNADGSEIKFDSSVFSTPRMITLAATLVLSETYGPEVIDGPGANFATVSGGGKVEVFDIESGVTASLSGLTINGGSANIGGGLYNGGTVTLSGCSVSGNSASRSGGGLVNGGTATLFNCTISANSAGYYTSFDGGGVAQGYGGGLLNSGTATLSDCAISGNSAGVGGGGLENFSYGAATVSNCTISGNLADDGGGVDNGYGTATLINCTISGNSARSFGGGLNDGGLHSATLSLYDCTVSGNSARSAGGGLENYSATTLSDCTISGNSAADGAGLWSGGGLGSHGGTAKLIACTISGNLAGLGGGGLYIVYSTATLTDTIVAGNTDGNGTADNIDLANNGNVNGTYNLIGTGGSGGIVGGSNGNIVGVADPLLALLGNYGGPTQTIALLPGSPAMGAGTTVSGITADQRGVSLPASGVDIGAFQSQGFTLSIAGGSPQSAAVNTEFADSLVVTVTANDPLEPVAGGVVTFGVPSSGASAILSAATATIGNDGMASVTASANGTTGTYAIAALAAGAASAVDFELTNDPSNLIDGLSVKYGGFVYNRAKRQFTQTLTITNISGAAIMGPINLVLLNLENATLANETGTDQGNPYIAILSSGSLGAGQSLTVTLTFVDPTLAPISFTPEFLAGPIPSGSSN